jgi:hypothetical protein
VGGQFGEEGREIGFGELPLERLCRCFPIILEVEPALCELVEAGEVVRRGDFSLHDGKVDLDLIKPTRVLAAPGLDAGFLVGRDDKFITFEGLTFPDALIQIEDSVGLDGECGVPGEDPTAVIPR